MAMTRDEVWGALAHSEKVFADFNRECDRVDQAYADKQQIQTAALDMGFTDKRYDLFWSSMEVLKPSIYAKPPRVVVKPRFSDANATDKLTSELIERNINSAFERGYIDDSLLMVRDDVALINRGVLWLSLDKGNICVEWLDREDFRHEPARYWPEVGWVSRRAWLTQEEMRERFQPKSGDAYLRAFFTDKWERRGDDGRVLSGDEGVPDKAEVWEFRIKSENRVVWVTEGVDEFLDDATPDVSLDDFYPCPRPAYGTLRRRSLIPIPDYARYQTHLEQINAITRKIYDLLDQVRMRGLVAGGGDVASAVETAMREDNASSILIPVPGAALLASGGASNFVQWIPLAELATAIQGLIDAREALFMSFDRLSGISDIMRGETEAQETLGAQRLKSQYGSVRVRDKKDEIIRLSRDAAQIAGEIICSNFSQKKLLETAQMEVPTRAEVKKALNDLKTAAKKEMEALAQQAKQAAQQAQAQSQQIDPAQAKAQFDEQQRAIAEKFAPQFAQLQQAVVIEDVMDLIRDSKGRCLIIDIETDSTVMTDEIAEKASRSEFLTAFSGAVAAIQPLMMAGEKGAKLAGGIVKFALQPFNVSRDLEAMIDEFVEAAPEIAAQMGQQGGNEEAQAIAEANQKLAEAEIQKAQAATQKVNADSQLKMFELQQKQAVAQTQAQQDAQRFDLEIAQTNGALDETNARIEKIMAEIQKIGVDANNQTRQQDREDVKTVADISARQVDQAQAAQRDQRQAIDGDRNAAMSERQQSFSEQQGERSDERAERAEERADRQQDLAERQPKP